MPDHSPSDGSTAGPAGWVLETPIGPLRLQADAAGSALVAIRFEALRPLRDAARTDPTGPGVTGPGDGVLGVAARQLGEYFAGHRRVFALELGATGTDFQQAVWREVALVPWGTTVTYGEIARRLGLRRGAARAVGAANGANPLPIVVPCHRVIGADGTLTGYAGGLARKRALLHLEGVSTREDRGVSATLF